MLLGDIEVSRWEEIKVFVDTLAVGGAPLCTDSRGQLGLYARVASMVIADLEQGLAGRVLRLPVILLEDGLGWESFVGRSLNWRRRLGCSGPLVLVGVGIPGKGLAEAAAGDGAGPVVLALSGEEVLAQAVTPEALDHAVAMWSQRLLQEVVHRWEEIQAS
ncbi:MAG: hypothetical protein QJR01_00805 [Kyrpidia sp.]|nr:hypothetical protein [Kyrpidia sp.]